MVSWLAISIWLGFYYVVKGAVISIDYRNPISRLNNTGNLYLLDIPLRSVSSPRCGDGSPYSFAFKKGKPEYEDKLVIEFMGGQQTGKASDFCWSEVSCMYAGPTEFSIPWKNTELLSGIDSLITGCRGVPDDFMRPYVPAIIRGEDEPGSIPLGLRDEASFGKVNITDWNYLYLPHCTQDLFLGHKDKPLTNWNTNDKKFYERYHSGAFNAKAVMQWVYKSFPVLDTMLFTGCGAGAAVAPPLYAAQAARHYNAQAGKTPVQQIYALMDSPTHLLTDAMAHTNSIKYKTGIHRWEPFEMLPNFKDQQGGNVLLREIEATVKEFPQIRFGIFANKNDQSNLEIYRRMNGNKTNYPLIYVSWLSDMKQTYPNFNYFVPDGESHCKFAFSEANKLISPTWKTQFQKFSNDVTINHQSSAIIISEVKNKKSQRFSPTPLTLALIAMGGLCVTYILWFVIMTIRKRNGYSTPTPFQIWIATICRFPLLFLTLSLAVPITLSVLGFKSSGYSIDVNLKFESFLDIDADLAYFAGVFENSRKQQDQIWKGIEASCKLVNDQAKESRRLAGLQRRGEKVILFYENKFQTNVFTPDVLLEIRAFEKSIMSFPGWSNVCYQARGGQGECAIFDSPVNVFFNEKGQLQDIQSTLQNKILTSGNLQNVDQYFSYSNLGSNFTRSTFYLRKGADKSFLEKLYRELLWPNDQNGKYGHLQYSWSNPHLQEFEAFEALKSDLWWSLGTLLLVLVFISVKVRNPFLIFFALSGLLLSFPVAYFCYYVIFGVPKFSLMNFTALFVMLGIGADDIFLMVDSYKHTKVFLGEDASIDDRMKMAYKKAGSTMLVTSLTTAFCFYSNFFSILKIVQEFGLYTGTVIMINYFHVMTILPSAIVVNGKYVEPLFQRFLQSCRGQPLRGKDSNSPIQNSLTENHIEQSGCVQEDVRVKGEEENIPSDRSAEQSILSKNSEKLPIPTNSDVELGEQTNVSQNVSSKTTEDLDSVSSASRSFDHNHGKENEELSSENREEQNDSDVSGETNDMKSLKDRLANTMDSRQMGKMDSWFYNTYSPFIYRWRKLCIVFFLAMSLSLGLSGYFKFEQASGNLVVFKDKYNLGRVMRIENDHYNDYFQYGQEEDSTWSPNSASTGVDIEDGIPVPNAPPPSPTTNNLPTIPIAVPLVSPTRSPTRSPTESPTSFPTEFTTPVPTREIGSQSCVPTQIPNSLFYSNVNSLQGEIGDSVDVICRKQYIGGGTIICQSDGKWSIIAPCVPQTNCPTLNIENSNAENNGKSFKEGDTFGLVCNEGYTGETTMTCTSNLIWDPLTFICDPNPCESTEIQNSDKSETDSIKGVTGDTVSITCNDGYRGSGFVTCESSGQFSSLKCDNECLFTFKNSKNGLTNAITNEDIMIECMDGFQGGGMTTCQQDGNFMPAVSCLGTNQCPSIFIQHAGFLEGGKGDKVDILCLEGYAGGGTATCTDSISWDIVPTCSAMECEPLNHENAIQNFIEGKTGDIIEINCLEDYLGGGEVTCLSNGEFETSKLLPCIYKFTEPKPPIFQDIVNLKTPPISVTIQGTFTDNSNIFNLGNLNVICQIFGINESTKVVDSFYPEFKVNFTQNDLEKYGIIPERYIRLSCYTQRIVDGQILKSSETVSGFFEIQAYPDKPSIDFEKSNIPGLKNVTIIVSSSPQSWDKTKLTQFQCEGQHKTPESKKFKETKDFTTDSTGNMTITVPNFDVEFVVQCRLKNRYGWSKYSESYITFESVNCIKPCLNGGLCNSTIGECACPIGREGIQCEDYYCPVVDTTPCGKHGKCETHPDGPEKGNICKCDDGWTELDCSMEIPKAYRKTTSYTVSLVWGMQSSQTDSNIWNLGSSRGNHTNALLNPIDIADPDIQRWLLEIVTMARSESKLRIDSNVQTWIEALKTYAAVTQIDFPIERSAFPVHLNKMINANQITRKMRSHIGTNGVDPLLGDFTYVSIDLLAEVPDTSTHIRKQSLKDAFELWEKFLDRMNEDSPMKVGKAVLHSGAFFEIYREDRIVTTTMISWIVSNALCVLIILIFTQNFLLSFWVMVTLILMITCLLGLMFAVYSIPFGPIEALGVSVFVGLSSSYVLHLVHAYLDTTDITRRGKIREAVFAVSSPLSASALSTVGACAFLLACRIYLFVELGILMCTNNFIALMFALVFLVALLSMIGPRQYEGKLSIHQWDFSAVYSGIWRKTRLAKNCQTA